MTTVDAIVPGTDRLGESPVWCERSGRLYWVDARGPTLQWIESGGTSPRRVPLPSLVGAIALREGAGLVAAMADGFHRLDPETGMLEPIVDPEADQPDNRFNDGRVDRQGRFWAGTMNDVRRDPTGALYRLDPDGACHRLFGDVIVPNSLAWSPDARVMYFADTYRHRISAFAFDAERGVPSSPRVLVDLTAAPGRPDGSAVDADGCLWNAEYAGGRVVRYTPAGRVDRVIPMPVSNPTSCAFGGPGLDTLFVTSARQRLTPEQLAREPLAGSLFAIRTAAVGLPEPRFRG